MPFWNRRRPLTPTDGVVTTPALEQDLEAAYEKGRRDERADRKRHPVIMTCLILLAAVGASMVTLAAVNGSFSNGGEVADQQLASAAEQAAPVLQDAASRTGEAARQAGADLKSKGHDLITNEKN